MILTITYHTFCEAFRKKILHILVGLGVFIISLSPFFPTMDEPDAHVKIVLVVFFQVVILLCISGIIFLAASSLPGEIEDKTILGILSKPVSRIKIIMGKVAGFAMLSALVLVFLSLMNLIIVYWIASGLPDEYRGILKARNLYKSSQFHVQGKVNHASREILWIEGGRVAVAHWSFSDLYNKSDKRRSYELELDLKVDSSKDIVENVPLVVRVEDVFSGESKIEIISLKIDELLTLKLNSGFIQKSGNINVSVFPLSRTDYIGVSQNDAKVYSVYGGFLSNYVKAIFITFLKFLLIIFISVMGSTYLSAPVSIATSMVVFLSGHVLDYVKDFSILIQRYDIHKYNLPTVIKEPNILLVYFDYIIRKPLEWLTVILPDFKRFDSLNFLLNGINVPLEIIIVSLRYTAIYAVICLFISYLVFRKREIF